MALEGTYGGAMWQAGMMAAAGLYAFEHHVERLKDDHTNARRLAQIVQAHELIDVVPVETNIVMIDMPASGILAQDMMMGLEHLGINIGAFGPYRLRAVTHLDVSAEQIEEAGQAILATLDRLRAAT